VVLADAGVENVNAQVDELIATGVLRRVLAFTELRFSNSMIEEWWRSLTHQWLFLHPLDSVATIRRLVAFYVDEHNRVLPHSAFQGQTSDEMYFGTGDAVPADLTSRAAAARRARAVANRSAACETCPSLDAVAPDNRGLAARPTRRTRGHVRLEAPAASTGPRGHTSRRAAPCPGSASPSISRPLTSRMARIRAGKCRMSLGTARRFGAVLYEMRATEGEGPSCHLQGNLLPELPP
jgi:hypothetical protein